MKKYEVIGETSFNRIKLGTIVYIYDKSNGKADITDGVITDLISLDLLLEV